MDKIFKGNNDYTKSAFLNWRTSNKEDIANLLVLADGFMFSSIHLCLTCLENNEDKKADILIFPILHNANHGIELYLKAMIWTLNRLLGGNLKFDSTHNIQQLFQTVQEKICNLKGSDWLEDFDEQNKNLSAYICELFDQISVYGKGNNMDFSRYPTNNKFENHFYIDSLEHVEIDLANFKESLTKIRESLNERVSYFFYQELKGAW